MDTIDTYSVCRYCFTNSLKESQPTLEKFRDKDGCCKTCGYEWISVSVGYDSPHRKWCIIRPRPLDSKLSMCSYKMTGKCSQDWKCKRAHNQLELEMWTQGGKILGRKRVNTPKFGCVICQIEYTDIDNLRIHLMGKQHETKAQDMCILPEVGSSVLYTGPIRTRPRLAYGIDSHELCCIYARHGRCQFGTGCRHAHSTEELTIWMDALTTESFRRQDKVYYTRESNSAYSRDGPDSSEGATNPFPSGSVPTLQNCAKPRFFSSNFHNKFGEEPEYAKAVYQKINDYGIEPCLRNSPKHIKVTCDRPSTVTVEESSVANEISWMFFLKTTQSDELNTIVLLDSRKIFALGEVFRCSTKGSGFRKELQQKFVPKRTSYSVCQSFNQDSYFEVILNCKPEVGVYKAQIIFQIKDTVLVTIEVKVKTYGPGFEDICESFKAATKLQRKRVPSTNSRVPMVEELLKVNWEHGFELRNATINRSHSIPPFVEKNINSGYSEEMPIEIYKEYYVERFHTLLYFEEFEHKRSLMKYDLPDQKITFHSVEEKIFVKRVRGQNYFDTAPNNTRFLTLKLHHRLFEGYRSFRPPKIAYVIPNGTKVAYEYSVYHMGMYKVIILIHMDLITACQPSGGLALVRFAPERKDYVQMHESLDLVDLFFMFPMLLHVKMDAPYNQDLNYLLHLLEREELSFQQKEAVHSIVDSNYQSYPTIISGPFGCGKTKTLSVAARLISHCFSRAKVLIVTKTNSSANLYVELLQDYFDTFAMYRANQCNKRVMFRHFSFSRSLQSDEESVKAFANIEGESYERITFHDLKDCSVVVTNLAALGTLIPRSSRHRSKSLFTHIFLDEAAQVIEPEACLALSLAGYRTKIVLAGDVYQTKPLILSEYGKQYGLDESLLQRFARLPVYTTGALWNCKVEMRENFRSRETIVKFLSELFYGDSLISHPPSLTGPTNYPALSFLHVSGDEQALHGFPSYYNKEEADFTMRALRKFVAAGVLVENIGVLSTHKAQVGLINEALKSESVACRRKGHSMEMCAEKRCIGPHITVRNLEGVQGREYDLIIVNTVRTLSKDMSDVSFEEKVDLGLLDDVTQFNTILTRARGWVLVIGDMDCILKVGECLHVWYKYIKACEDVKGLFLNLDQFENFNIEGDVP